MRFIVAHRQGMFIVPASRFRPEAGSLGSDRSLVVVLFAATPSTLGPHASCGEPAFAVLNVALPELGFAGFMVPKSVFALVGWPPVIHYNRKAGPGAGSLVQIWLRPQFT